MKFCKQKRKAYIGLSGPILYDYRNSASKTSSDTKSSPNPILESPFGLLLLYDEIYFLCRSLCPQNMRELKYVHFLDEEGLFPSDDDDEYFDSLLNTVKNNYIYKDCNLKSNYNKGIRELKIEWGINWLKKSSDHSHKLNIQGLEDVPSFLVGCTDLPQLTLDLIIYDKLMIDDIDFITNSFTSLMINKHNEHLYKSSLSELLLIENIPNYLMKMGPYHQCIEEIREDSYLKEFRKWICNTNLSNSKGELKDVKKAVESSLKEAQDRVFLKYFQDHSFFKSCGKSFCGDLLGLIMPGVGTATNISEKLINKNIAHKWQSFLVSARGKINI